MEEISRSQAVPLNPHTNILRLTPSELQHWGSSLKGTSGIQGGTEVSDIKAEAGGQLFPRQKDGQKLLSLFQTLSPQSHSTGAPYMNLHQSGS